MKAKKDVRLGKARVDVEANTSEHDKSIDKAESKIRRFGESVTKTSKAAIAGYLSLGAAAATAAAIIKDGTMLNAEWDRRVLRTNALLRATGEAVGYSAKELSEFAKQRDLATLGDKESILDAINALQTFKSVQGETFKRAIVNAQNLAAVFGGDVKSQAISLGKALEDPIKGINALSRSGVSFTAGQKELIKSLVESNKVLDAQSIILKEIEGQVGGTAEAEATGLSGSIDTLSFEWRELKESFEQTDAAVKGVNAIVEAVRGTRELIDVGSIDDQIKAVEQKLEDLGSHDVNKPWKGGREFAFMSPVALEKAMVKKRVEYELELENLRDIKILKARAEHMEKMDALERKALAEKKRKIDEEIEAQKAAQAELYNLSALTLTPEEESSFKKFNKDIEAAYSEIAIVDEAVKEAGKETLSEIKDMFTGISDNFTQAVQNSMGGAFSDALREDLETATDYVRSFANTSADIVGAGISQAVLKAFQGQTVSAGTWGALGVAGAATFAISSVLNRNAEGKAEEARLSAIRKQLDSELSDSIAKLSLSDTAYDIFKLEERIKALTKSANESGYAMQKIIELRGLETKEILEGVRAKYTGITDSASDWLEGLQRESWSISDWKSEQDRLYSQLMSLDDSSQDYQDESIGVLNDLLSVIQSTYALQKEKLSSLGGASASLGSQIWSLTHGSGTSVSLPEYENRYQDLLSSVHGDDGVVDTGAVADLQAFINEYIDIANGVIGAGGYSLRERISTDLEDIKIDVDSDYEELRQAINANTDALSSEDGVTNAIERLTYVTQRIAGKKEYDAWQELKPDVSNVPGSSLTGSSGYTLSKELYTNPYGDYIDIKKYITGSSLIAGWASSIDPNVSESVSDWLNDPRFTGYNPDIMSAAYIDTDNNKVITHVEIASVYAEAKKQYEDLLSWFNSVPTFGDGGLATGRSYAGESGEEWIAPAYNNPKNTGFLQSVGIPQLIESMRIDYGQLAAAIIGANAKSSGPGGTIQINFDGRAMADIFIDQINTNSNLRKSVKRLVNG